MKKNNNLKLFIIAVIAVGLIAALVSGSTFAYWRWQTSDGTGANGNSATDQRTHITTTVEGGELTIDGTNVTNNSMYPTSDCDGAAALIGAATVTAKNDTSTAMTVTLKLRGTVTAKQGTLNTTNKGKLNWAIVDTSDTTKTCSSPTVSGTLASVSSNTDFNTGITFTATANATTTKNYRLYVWLDSTYEYINIGTTVSDPMQNLTLSVKWSPASTMVQS